MSEFDGLGDYQEYAAPSWSFDDVLKGVSDFFSGGWLMSPTYGVLNKAAETAGNVLDDATGIRSAVKDLNGGEDFGAVQKALQNIYFSSPFGVLETAQDTVKNLTDPERKGKFGGSAGGNIDYQREDPFAEVSDKSYDPFGGYHLNNSDNPFGDYHLNLGEQPAGDAWGGLTEDNYGTYSLHDLENAMSGAYVNAGNRQGDEKYAYGFTNNGERPNNQSIEGQERQQAILGKTMNTNAALNQSLGDMAARWTEGSEDVSGSLSNTALEQNKIRQSDDYKKLIDIATSHEYSEEEQRKAWNEAQAMLANASVPGDNGPEPLGEYVPVTDQQRANTILRDVWGVDPEDRRALAEFVEANKAAGILGENDRLDYSTYGPISQAINETFAAQGTGSDPVEMVNAAEEAQMSGENDAGAANPAPRADINNASRPAIENAVAQAMYAYGDEYLDWVPSEIYARFLESGGGNAQAYPTLLDFQLDSSQAEFYEFIEVCHQLYGMYSELYADGEFDQDKYDIWWAANEEKNVLGDQSAHDVFCVDYQNSELYIDALYGGAYSQAVANNQITEEEARSDLAKRVRVAIIQAMEMNMYRDTGYLNSSYGPENQFTTTSTWTPSVSEDMIERLYKSGDIDVGTYQEGGEYSAHNNANQATEPNWDILLGSVEDRNNWANNLDLNGLSEAQLDDIIMQMMIARNQAANKPYRG